MSNEQVCATCKHFLKKPAGNDWCEAKALFLPRDCRGCPAWEARARHWSEEAARDAVSVVSKDVRDEIASSVTSLAERIRRHHDAACKRPDYEAMARVVLVHLPSLYHRPLELSLEDLLREADGGGK